MDSGFFQMDSAFSYFNLMAFQILEKVKTFSLSQENYGNIEEMDNK